MEDQSQVIGFTLPLSSFLLTSPGSSLPYVNLNLNLKDSLPHLSATTPPSSFEYRKRDWNVKGLSMAAPTSANATIIDPFVTPVEEAETVACLCTSFSLTYQPANFVCWSRECRKI